MSKRPAPPRTTPQQVRTLARGLVKLAEASSLVLTIEQVNQQPPAMGNYITVVSVRPARSKS